jgi:hypothetical protein
MSGIPGELSTKPTELPARMDRLFPWSSLDRRCAAVREFSADITELWQDLGGVGELSAQKRWVCERIVFMRRRMVAYESAVMAQGAAIEAGTEPPKLPMTAGEYSNFANVCQGLLKMVGLERRARRTQGLHEYLDSIAEPAA